MPTTACAARDDGVRDWLTQDDDARATYIAAKRDITADGEMDPDVYRLGEGAMWVTAFLVP